MKINSGIIGKMRDLFWKRHVESTGQKCVQDLYRGMDDFCFSFKDETVKNRLEQILSKKYSFHPIIILGRSGAGKTHLMDCLERELLWKNRLILRVSCEDVMNQMIESIRFPNRKPQMLDYYRKYDVIVIEEIEYAKDRESLQAELAAFTERLSRYGKQIILCGGGRKWDYNVLLEEFEYRHQKIDRYRLHILNRGERAFYIWDMSRRVNLNLTKDVIKELSAVRNMGTIVGRLNSLLVLNCKENGRVVVNVDRMKEVFG